MEPGDERKTGRAFGALIALTLAAGVGSFFYAMRHWWMPPVASAQGVEVDRLFVLLLVIIGVVFVVVHVGLALLLTRHGAHKEARAAYWHENKKLELSWTLIPAAILITLTVAGELVWVGMRAEPAAAAGETVVVEVTAQQFGWTMRYPGEDRVFGATDLSLVSRENPLGLDPEDPAGRDDLIVPGQLWLPVNRPARIELHSKDVIHSFFVPNFRIKQDAVPGRPTETLVTPTEIGRYEIACAELCGVGHFAMRGELHVVSDEDFAAWLSEQAETAEPAETAEQAARTEAR